MAKILDIETNGLLKDLTTIHCIALRDTDTGDSTLYFETDGIQKGLSAILTYVAQGGVLVGHNLIDFDIPALTKVYPLFSVPEAQIVDTLVLSRLIFTDMWDTDAARKNFPRQLCNRHSLEAWGYRMGEHKGDYTGDSRITDEKERKRTKWDTCNPDMLAYCVQDTEVTLHLYRQMMVLGYSKEAMTLEHQVRGIISAQEKHGFCFDVPAAVRLYSQLTAEKLVVEEELKAAFPPKYLPKPKLFTPLRDNKTQGYTAGAPIRQVVLTEFSASNRNHIVWWLKRMYGWEPSEFSPDGKPKMDEAVLASLEYPEVQLLKKFLLLDKRIAQISTGNEAWLKHQRNGKMYGQVNTNGAVTGRATHSKPNLGQVPAVYSPYGKECRALFTASPGRVLVGADQSGVELRCLAHYMGRWDDGAYAAIILGGDIHTANQLAAGLPNRDMAKTFIYAFLYGAGDAKLGSIVGKGQAEGKKLRAAFLRKLPALGSLVEAVAKAAKAQKYLVGIDGRLIHVRSSHAALNSLLQAAGAVLAKKSMVIMRQLVADKGYESRAHQVVWNHDEMQWDCDPLIADEIGKMQVEAFKLAGEYYNFRIPIDGEYKVGPNWATTH
jgi:DNA polymerase-1